MRGTPGLTLSDSVSERLLRERIIILGSEVRDSNANEITAQLLLLAAEDQEKDITLYINSPGGSVTAGMAIYDTMMLVEPDVATTAMGLAASMGQFLLTAGAPGKRSALPHARILMHQPSAGVGGTAADIAIQADMLNKSKREMAELIAQHTGQPVERIIIDSDPYNKLFEERIIFLGVQIDDASANDVMAQLLTLESTDPDREIIMYINSPGGSFTSMTAIYDTMQFVRPHIQTVCLGQAASAAAVLLAAGSPGRRLALPNSRILIHQPATEGVYGQVSDLEIQANEIGRMRAALEEILSRHSNKTPEEVRRDIDRDKILTASEAKDYGLIDEVLEYRKLK